MIKFGENEFKVGNKERGRTYFESVLENSARRVDVWSVYLDMEIKYGDDGEKVLCVSHQLLILSRVQLRTMSAQIIRHARTQYVGESQSCMF